MTTLTRKYKERLESVARLHETPKIYKNKRKFIELNELYPETLDGFAKMYRYLGIVSADGKVMFIDEMWCKKHAI